MTTCETFLFPNHLDRRNAAALPHTAIVLDIFKLDVFNSKKPRDGFQAIIAVDLATAEIIAHAVFRIPNSLKGQVPAIKVIAALKDAFRNRTFDDELLIHTDRGPQFTSQEWTLFINELGAIGSMSNVATPNDNAVAERTIRTIKHQLFECNVSWPKRVKSLREIQLVLDQRVTFYNHQFRPKRACGITPAELRPTLDAVNHLAPPRVLARANHDVNHKAVVDFKKNAVDLRNHPFFIIQTTRDSVLRIEQKTEHLHHKIDLIQQQLTAIAQGRNPNPPKHKRLPLRDPANNTVYNWLMRKPRAHKQPRISFLRFRLAIALLRHTGMRAAEVAEVRHEQIESAIQYGHLDIILAKTLQTHRYVFTQAARDALSKLQYERMLVFAQHNRLAGVLRGNHSVEFINLNLQPSVKHFGLNLTSHSFRVGYVAHLLQYAPAQHVAAIVGHSDIRSTLAYNQYVPDRDAVIQLLERGQDH